MLDFLDAQVEFQPTQFFVDYDALICQCVDVPWDDNFDRIDVPILESNARGGSSFDGRDPALYTSSNDVTRLDISPDPSVDILADFGHIDLFLAPVAREIAWPQLLDWINEHRTRRGRGHGTYTSNGR